MSGYALEQLLPEHGFHVARSLVGSEATCVTVLEATVALVPDPPHRSLLLLGYPDIYAAADDVPEVLGFDPIGLEGVDEMLVEDMSLKHLHDGDLALRPGVAARRAGRRVTGRGGGQGAGCSPSAWSARSISSLPSRGRSRIPGPPSSTSWSTPTCRPCRLG